MEYEIIRLSNGIRVVFQYQNLPVTHVCMVINAGSRDESAGKYGVAHFIEHLLFKRTERRSTQQIINHLESVGGDLNAYTTKEYTCVHASILQPYLNRALDLFEDIFFHSTFPDIELDKEKSVIVDEMASYLDSPEESIVDDFEDLVFQGSGLGHNILGLEDQLLALQKGDIVDFMRANYDTNEMVIGITGNYTLKEVERLLHKVFGTVPSNTIERLRNDVRPLVEQHVAVGKPINQVHYMLGSLAYNYRDDRKTGLLLLNNMLGGMGMGSILNLSIREKYGIAYTIESNYTIFSDTGLFSIYLGTDEEKVEKAKKLVFKELAKLSEQPLSETAVKKAKQKFIGQIALTEENRMSMIISAAKNVMDYDRVILLDEVIEKIQDLTNTGLLEIAQDVFDPKKMLSLSFVPED
ncbi:insulinase family protein [Sphingobacterium paramultivorum]|uniref:Insulinase family protein n=1 Tax=Sphingobacterium paramultivorum TaxID=2886510 RepID=A0A7G5E7P1_9SPHI|nr:MULTISPECIES: pitrilysin family protein [Sphingobacterium]MCS4168425.1 putative Zn-dependent peptidase [Sphingobacterium sp. BIGb0116]QMV70016.1 insulinase family protein [Sphingobacterium paramultivorum]WSO13848.1 pitrilysin family protein [Sphingobacterium paramultivorum]